MIFTLKFHLHSISPQPFGRFSLNISQKLLSESCCAKIMTGLLHRPKVKVTVWGHGFNLEFGVRSISLEHFERFSLNFTQMFTLVRQWAEPIDADSRLRSQFNVKEVFLEFRVCSTYHQPFSLNFTWMFPWLSRCSESTNQLCKIKFKVTHQGHGIL